MIFLMTFVLLFCNQAIAFNDLDLAPPSFKANGKKFVFIDLQRSNFEIEYNLLSGKALVKSTLDFETREQGQPLFDLVEDVISAELDGQPIEISEVRLPTGVSRMKAIASETEPGRHILVLRHQINNGLQFEQDSVRSAFWMSDLSDRRFLERYLPGNLEFDHVQMNFTVNVAFAMKRHVVKSNCASVEIVKNTWALSCPSSFTSSQLFFHLYEEGRHAEANGQFTSIDGRKLALQFYGSKAEQALQKAIPILSELEADYGPWPFPSLLVYTHGSGGMEYAGATVTSLWALGHELHHSYFARSAVPVRGNAGWIDEALASWRDKGYPRYQEISSRAKSSMAGHSIYRRSTDGDAYGKGPLIIGHLDHLFSQQGGFKSFLKDFHKNFKHRSFSTEVFKTSIEEFFATDLSEVFSKYIYGESEQQNSMEKGNNPFHPRLSESDLRSML